MTVPLDGFTLDDKSPSSVLLPEPFGPSSTVAVPASKRAEASRSATVEP